MISEREFEELVAAEAKATKGPWKVTIREDGAEAWIDEPDTVPIKEGVNCQAWLPDGMPTLQFVSLSRNSLPGLIEFVRRAVELIEGAPFTQEEIVAWIDRRDALLADWRRK